MCPKSAPRVIGWRLQPEIKEAVEEYARQTRRSVVGAAEVLLESALKAAAERGEWTPAKSEGDS